MSRAYTDYIVAHKENVKKAYDWLKSHNIIKGNLETQIMQHDLSKYLDEEYGAYDHYFYGTKTKEVKEAFDYAWLHHIHHNPHHWQYWVLVNDEDGTKALEMPKEYAIEMVCDWWAFSHKSGNLKEIFDWYKSHKKNMILHEKTRKFVEDLLDKIKKVLEEED
jgi:hypothetical protein